LLTDRDIEDAVAGAAQLALLFVKTPESELMRALYLVRGTT